MTNKKFNLWILLYDDGFQCLCGMYNQAYRNVFGRTKRFSQRERMVNNLRRKEKKESAQVH